MNRTTPSSIEQILEILKTKQIEAQLAVTFINAIETKFKTDIDILFSKLAGGHIHEIQSKIGYAKNLLNLVIESNGAFDYKNALESAITQIEDILAVYRTAGVSTQIK